MVTSVEEALETALELAQIASPAAKVKSPAVVIVCSVVVEVQACPEVIASAVETPRLVECGRLNVQEGTLEASEVIRQVTLVMVIGTSNAICGEVR